MAEQQWKELAIEVRFVGQESFAVGVVAKWLTQIERAVFNSERDDIEALQQALGPEIPAPYFDAIRYRFDSLRGRTVNISYASNGSIILLSFVGAASMWLLDKTLGEAVKESWKQSSWHQKATSVLSARMMPKARKLAATFERIEPTLDHEGGHFVSEGQSAVEENTNRITIKLTVLVNLPPIPTSIGEPRDGPPNELPPIV